MKTAERVVPQTAAHHQAPTITTSVRLLARSLALAPSLSSLIGPSLSGASSGGCRLCHPPVPQHADHELELSFSRVPFFFSRHLKPKDGNLLRPPSFS